MVRRSNILRYLNINLDIKDCDIKFVSSLNGGENCLAFYKFSFDLNEISRKFIHSLLLVPDEQTSVIYDNAHDNVLVPVDYPRYRFAEYVLKFNLTTLYNSPTIFDPSQIRRNAEYIGNNVTIENTIFGKGCKFYNNVIVGATDYCPIQSVDGKSRLMFPQLGFVKLGNRVEVFPNSIIGRGALCITEIGDDTKIDALCQVGHNCKIGKNCVITAGCIIAGSVEVGDNVFVGIGSMIRNGLKIGNNVTIGQGSNVVKDIPDNAIVMGNPAKIVGSNVASHSATQVP